MAKAGAIKPVKAATPARTALRHLIASGAQGLARHLARMMTSDDIEFPHKARVDLRRLRATLTAFRPIIDRQIYHRHQHRLRDLARLIGPLRDADVLAHDLGLPELTAAAADLRLITRARLTQTRADRFALRLARAYVGKSWHRPGTGAKAARTAPVQPLAVAALDDIWRRSLSHGTDVTLLPEDQRHDLRKRLKTLRYLTDQFGLIWPGRSRDTFLALLADLQNDLGRLNDLVVARAHGLTPPDEPHTLAHAQTLWSRLLACPIFWANPDPDHAENHRHRRDTGRDHGRPPRPGLS